MKKHSISISLLLSSALYGQTIHANCTENQVQDLAGLLQGNTICVSNGSGGWESQEEHLVGGDLYDYKLGDGDPVDPRKNLGTWSVANNNSTDATVTYTYTAFGPATAVGPFKVYRVGDTTSTTYDFCNGTTLSATGSLKSGIESPCP